MRKSHVGAGIIIILLLIVGVGSCSYFTSTDNQHRESFTVNQVDDQSTGRNHQYLVFTNKGVFKDTDNLWLWKWNSSDVYNQLINWKGKTINCLVQGHRIHITSGYENIIGDCRLVTK